MHGFLIICNTVIPLNVLTAVLLVVIFPYAIAFMAGILNGRLMKIRNINRYVSSAGTERYRSKVSFLTLLFDMAGYSVFASFVVAIIVVVPNQFLAANAIGLVIFATASLYFFDSMAYVFYEMLIVGEYIYIYSHWSLFVVVKVPIADVIRCNSFYARMHSWIEFTANGRVYVFKSLRNGEDFVRAVNNATEM